MVDNKTERGLRETDGYLNTVNRLEPEIMMIDLGAFCASAAISLKRIADALEARNRLTAREQFTQEVADADKHDDWLVQRWLDDLIEGPARRTAALKRSGRE